MIHRISLAIATAALLTAGAQAAPAPGARASTHTPEKSAAIRADRSQAPAGISFELTVEATLPEAPEWLDLWAPAWGDPVTSIDALQDRFGAFGVAQGSDAYGGVDHVEDLGLHINVWEAGGAAVHDLSLMKSQEPIQPASGQSLLVDAEELLADLGLFDVAMVELVPAGSGEFAQEIRNPQGRIVARRVTHQTFHHQQIIDGLPGFGGGAEVDVVFGPGGEIASLSHAVRNLAPAGSAQVIPAEEALRSFQQRSEEIGRFSLIKAAVFDVEEVIVTEVELGLYVPSVAEPAGLYSPVWRIAGEVRGSDVNGAPLSVELLWFEPAAVGVGVPALDLPAAR